MQSLLTGIALFCITALPCALQNSACAQHTQGGAPRFAAYFKNPADSAEASRLLYAADSVSAESFDAAIALGLKALELCTANIGTADHPLLDSCYMVLGGICIQADSTDLGLKYMNSALDMAARLYPGGNAAMLDMYYYRAHLRELRGEPAAAIDDIQSAMNMLSSLALADSASYAHLYWYMGWLVVNQSGFTGAEPYFVRSLALQRQAVEPRSPALANFLYQLGWYYQNARDKSKAAALFDEALDIYRNDSTTSRVRLLDCAQSAAGHHATAGHFAKASALYDETEQLYRATPDADPLAFGEFLREKGDYLASLGKYNDAERLLFEAHDIFTAAGPDAVGYKLYSLVSIAAYYDHRGMHAEAEPYYIDAVDLARSYYGEKSTEYALALNNQATFYITRGRYKESLPLLEPAYLLVEAAGPLYARSGIKTLNNLAIAHDYLGNTAKADSLYGEVYRRSVAAFADTDPHRAQAENNTGSFYLERDRFEQAAPYLSRAVDIYRIAYPGEQHPHLATAIANQARLFAATGKPDSAEILFREALAMRRALFAMPHPDLLKSLRYYGEFLSARGRADEAKALFKEMMGGVYQRLNESFGFESEGSQLDFMTNILQPAMGAFSRFCLQHGGQDPELPELFMDALLKLKGAIANESARRSAEMHKNKLVLKLNTELTSLRERQAAFASRQTTPELAAERDQVRKQADVVDAALRKLDREYDKLLQQREAGWKDVQRLLKPGEALIEFSAVAQRASTIVTADVPYSYGAVVLKHEGRPALIGVCNESQLRPFIAAPVSPGSKDCYVTDPGRAQELYAILWKPLDAHLQGVTRVYISADGLLYRVAFAALCSSIDPQVNLEGVYDIRHLSGGRQLLERDARHTLKRERPSERFALVGAPDFAAAMKPAPDNKRKRYRSGWAALPGTAAEIDAIASACAERGIPAITLTGKLAREDSIKAMSDAPPRVLHLATHGFFFPAVEYESAAEERTRSGRSGAAQLRIIENPMLRSGLILMGANAVWTGEVPAMGSNDGILTALEISRLNLYGTELVTLSACETGLGDVRNGEGIFGLQRAFQAAGAECILMSLWKVADEPTAEMMKLFYRDWLSGKSKAEAFRAARETIRAAYPSPYVWAAFVMVGE